MVAAREAAVLHEVRFRAMGTDAHLAVVGGDDEMLSRGERHVRDLESRWSRFLDTSELNALNRHAGHLMIVSPPTFDLVAKALTAWRQTAGRFDPTVGMALAAHGYDRTFSEVLAAAVPVEVGSVRPAPGPGDIELIAGVNAVSMPVGVTLDAGGIGKGLAADMTADLLMDLGADGALVNLGGDLRVIGRAPSREGWSITVPDPLEAGRELLRLAVPEGAVATSSRLQRRWPTSTGEVHHLIDPRTGQPAQTEVVAVTVVAAEAWWAEALAKALFLDGPAALDEIEDLHAVVVTADGARHATPDLEATLR
jgi:thiamine biosynthesis lipoprotein